MFNPYAETLEHHATCTNEINKAVDAVVTKLIHECGYEPREVIVSAILASMRGVGRMVTGVPAEVRQMVRDRAFAEFYLGAAEPSPEQLEGAAAAMLKSLLKKKGGE